MANNRYVDFIDDDKLKANVEKVLSLAGVASERAEDAMHSNVIDPFSALFDASRQNISLTDWMNQEKARQIQKTLQNALGDFHQWTIGSIHGWESLPTGNLIDCRNMEKKIVAEVKNKFNTTKGSDKKSIYDNLLSAINSEQYKDFTGYYVEVIPKNRQVYNKCFVPSDNVSGSRRGEHECIRVIDGKSFYALASGRENALRELYLALPKVIADIIGRDLSHIQQDELFEVLFSKAY